MDQNYIQRYHTAKSSKQASKSVWLCVWMYVPASLLFFIIGTALYAFYQVNPVMIEPVKMQVVAEQASVNSQTIVGLTQSLKPADYGDKVLPYFMVTNIPTGLVGLIVSAILSAAMSTISSNMNSSATVFTMDIYKRYVNRSVSDKKQLLLLKLFTIVFGLIGLFTGLAMIGSKSLLDVWWELSGIFAGGMLGLFLLGLISKRTSSPETFTAVLIGIVIILWMTFSDRLPERYEFLRSPLHKNMIIVVGTLGIFLSGLLITRIRNKNLKYEEASGI
jgi:SSS family solute:Na+ symporter